MKKLSERQRLINMIPYRLLVWLCSSNLLGKFASNAIEDGFLLETENILRQHKNIELYMFSTAFSYLSTEEGEDFWFRRQWELKDYLENVNKRAKKWKEKLVKDLQLMVKHTSLLKVMVTVIVRTALSGIAFVVKVME